ncbi:MAG: site-2 protease family protein [Solirubrobacterales bacterium]
MPARAALTLFHVRGIRIGVDYTWFFVLFLIIIVTSDFYESVIGAGAGSALPYLMAVISALAFFGSIVLHELGHAIVAMRNGIGITEITLWMFGGVAHMARDTDSPGAEFRIAAAGPAVTLGIAAAGGVAGVALAGSEQGFLDAMLIEKGAEVSPVLALVAWLTSLNVLVLVFNLLPAFPLDGGRITRAIAWKITGERNKATRFAAGLGQGFSYLFMALGVLIVVSGDPINGLFIGMIGFLIGSSARGAVRQTALESRIEGLSVSDVMDSEPVSITGETTVAQALDEFFLRYRWPWFPVTDAAQRFLGLIEREAADAVPNEARTTRRVSEVLESDPSHSLQVRDDAPLDSLLGNDALRRLGALAAVDSEGRLKGIVTADQVGRALRDAMAEPPPAT